MKNSLNRVVPFLPWLGLVLIAAGAIVTFVTRRFDLLNNLLLGLGVLALLFFAVARPDAVRQMVSGRRVRYGLSTVLAIVFFGAIATLGYYLVYQNSDWRWDVTETQEFTPLPETVALLEQLDEPVHVIGFFTVQLSGQQTEAEKTLKSLAAVSDKITYEFQDPDANPVLARQYELNFNGTLVFTQGEVFAKANSVTDNDIHTALLKVINPKTKKLYFVTGHGERDIEDFSEVGLNTAVSFVEDLGFTVRPLSLIISGTVPADATAIAVIGAQGAMTPEEVQAIRDYLKGGGTAFIAQDVPEVDDQGNFLPEDDNIRAMLVEDWGITPRQDVILDFTRVLPGQPLPFNFVAADYGSSTIIPTELERFNTVYFAARSIATQSVEGVSTVNLVLTSGDAWGETNFAALLEGEVNPDPEDAAGPLAIGVSAENSATGGRIVVFGDADFISNQGLQGGNQQLFSNALNWLAKDEIIIELTPRETVDRQVIIPGEQLRLLQLISRALGPALMTIIGAVVWYSRRQHR